MPSSLNPSRREFAKSVAAVAVAPLLGGLSACTVAPPPAAPGPAPAVPLPGGPPLPSPAAPASGPGAEAGQEEDRRVEPLLAVIVARHGDRLTPEELEEVRRAIAGNLRAADRLRDFELPISVEPGFPFRVPPGSGR